MSLAQTAHKLQNRPTNLVITLLITITKEPYPALQHVPVESLGVKGYKIQILCFINYFVKYLFEIVMSKMFYHLFELLIILSAIEY